MNQADLLTLSKEELITQIIQLRAQSQENNYHIHAVKPDIKNEELITLLEENSHDLVMVHDLEGNIIGYNRASEEVLSDEIKTMYDFIVPEFRDDFKWYLQRIREHKFDKGFIKVLDKNGIRRLLNYSNKLVINTAGEEIVHSIGHDITDLWNANKKLKSAEQSYKGLFNSSSEAIFILNTKGNVQDLNDTAKLHYSLAIDDVKGKSFINLGLVNTDSQNEFQIQFYKIL